MKIYITIAALLAAGSAFANANPFTLDKATGYVWLDENGSFQNKSGLTFETGDSRDYTLAGASFFAPSDLGTRTQGTIAFEFNADKFTGTDHVSLVDVGVWGLGYKDGVFTGDWNGTVYFSTGSISTYAVDNVISVLITMDDNGTQISMGGDASTNIWSKANLKGKIDSSSIKISALAASALTKMVVWDTGAYNDPTVLQGAYTTIAAAVPEPSAFGLLAGLGALALVSARRRRK